jgi:putative glutamine amidotransferase
MIERELNCNFVQLHHDNLDNLNYWCDKIDGVVLAGGVDIHPSVYGSNVISDSSLGKFDFKRDIRELTVISNLRKQKKPIFAICRGHQLLSIHLGLGAQFIMDLNGSRTIHQPGSFNITTSEHDVMHEVRILDNTYFKIQDATERKIIRDSIGDKVDTIWVNSFHHQGVKYFVSKENTDYYSSKGIQVAGVSTAEIPKQVKIIELMFGENFVSCQWHPEYDYENNTASRQVINCFRKMLGL